jgi:uncharacterized protein
MTATVFEPGPALAGGALIGLAAALLMLSNGRILGASGIFSGLLTWQGWRDLWRPLFVLGVVGGAASVTTLSGAVTPAPAASPFLAAVAGLLVGFGALLGSGCTSGHGVCGMARGSLRSVVATLTFMATAALTVFIVRHVMAGAA